MNLRKTIFLSTSFMFFMAGFTFADNDILEEIDQGLEKPRIIQKQEPYLVSLFKAMTNKNSYIVYKELYFSSRYSTDLDQAEGRNSAGFILFGTFSGPEGQLGDMNLQFRAAYYNNQFEHGEKMPREYTDKIDDYEIEFHNAYLRLRVLPPLLNMRVGHFYVPFGIQPWIDTHGTLLQSPAMEFTGVDRDWGIGIEGQNDKFEYQLALTRGSGMEYFKRDGNFVLSGKISTPRIGEHLNDWIGFSFLGGKLFNPMGVDKLRSWDMDEKNEKFNGSVLKEWRLGIDGQKIAGPARLRFEISGGKDAKKENVLGEFFEARLPLGKNNRWSAQAQLENLTQDLNRSIRDSDTTVRLGLIYNISANYNIQFVVSRDINTIFGEEDTWIGVLFYAQKGGGLLNW